MFVSAWTPSPTISLPEISTIPVWLTLKNIPYKLYSIQGIDWIALAIGEPMQTSNPWFDPTQMGEEKILVEVKLNKQFLHKVALEDESGSIKMVDIVYSWLPSKCSSCGQLGHNSNYCFGLGIHSVPNSGQPAGGEDIRSESFEGNVPSIYKADVINEDPTSSSVINSELASRWVAASTSLISHELSSAVVSQETLTITPEPIMGSTQKINYAPESIITDVETSTSISVLSTPKAATFFAMASDTVVPAELITKKQTTTDTCSPNASLISSKAADDNSFPVLDHPISEVEVISPATCTSLSFPLVLDLGRTMCRNEILEGRYVREQGNNPFAMLDESEPVETNEEVEIIHISEDSTW